jgi:hypothetical protein
MKTGSWSSRGGGGGAWVAGGEQPDSGGRPGVRDGLPKRAALAGEGLAQAQEVRFCTL